MISQLFHHLALFALLFNIKLARKSADMTVVHGPLENHENRQNQEPNDPILRIRRNIKSEGNGMVIRDSRESRDGSINTPAPGKPRECAQRSGKFYLCHGSGGEFEPEVSI